MKRNMFGTKIIYAKYLGENWPNILSKSNLNMKIIKILVLFKQKPSRSKFDDTINSAQALNLF